ncbi:MAG: aminopeptidase [Candidatus Acidifodinimicrobium sp.]
MLQTWEVKTGAYKVVNELVRVRRGEEVLIYADTVIDPELVNSTAEQVYIAGGRPVVMWYETLSNPGEEPPNAVAAAMKEADAIIEYASKFLYITKAYSEAIKSGARHLCLTGMTPEMVVRCITKVDTNLLARFGTKLTELTRKAKDMRIKSRGGTDISFSLEGRPVFLDTGITTRDHPEAFLGGQISWAPVEETINGTLVFDGSIWPPESLGLLREPVTLKIEKGRIVEFSKNEESELFKKWLSSFNDQAMYNIAHACYGFNPGARLTGNILEDERVFGIVEFGIGSQGESFMGKAGAARSHTDGIVLSPTVWLDDQLIEKDGVYVHPELEDLARALLNNSP